MKKIILSTLLFLVVSAVNAQDSLYIYKDGTQTHKIAVSEIDSMTFSSTVDTTIMEVTDVDGNVYKTVKIGNQIWMAENLRVTKYNDGTIITKIISQNIWRTLESAAYCWYDNDSTSFHNDLGILYNHFTVSNDKEICPIGWRVPSNDDILELVDYAGGSTIVGLKLKEVGSDNWYSNEDVTNDYGFTAIGSGYRAGDGNLDFEGRYTSFSIWGQDTDRVYELNWINGNITNIQSGGYTSSPKQGSSIRCLKN